MAVVRPEAALRAARGLPPVMAAPGRRGWRARLGWWLRCAADRIDPNGAPRMTNRSFTFEKGRGIVIRSDGIGCPLWYLGREDYERAHEESDTPTDERVRFML